MNRHIINSMFSFSVETVSAIDGVATNGCSHPSKTNMPPEWRHGRAYRSSIVRQGPASAPDVPA